jgi:hypothetical protein
MWVIGFAAIVSGLIAAAPISAVADQTITESFSVTVPPSVVPNGLPPASELGGDGTTPLVLFNPSIGTLDNVSVMLSGSISAVSIAENPSVGFVLFDPQMNLIVARDIPLSAKFELSLSTASDPNRTDFVAPQHRGITLFFGTANPEQSTVIESVGPLIGSITFEYSPSLKTLAVHETSTWAMMLLGLAGLLALGRWHATDGVGVNRHFRRVFGISPTS